MYFGQEQKFYTFSAFCNLRVRSCIVCICSGSPFNRLVGENCGRKTIHTHTTQNNNSNGKVIPKRHELTLL